MFSYDHATGVMYTCDAFGMHYCSEDVYDTELDTIAPHYRYAGCGTNRCSTCAHTLLCLPMCVLNSTAFITTAS